MFLVTAEEMRECDRRTIEDCSVLGPVLMERAARGIRAALVERYRPLNRRRICIVCGRGNNGGDGLLVARLLFDDGLNPRVFLTDPVAQISGDAALQIPPLSARGIPLEPICPERIGWIRGLAPEDLIVDAILGTGFKGTVAGVKAEVIEAINASRAHVVAVDIPSGLSADSREVSGPAVQAELTVTMAFPKRSFLFWPARAFVGEWKAVDIGVPSEVVAVVRPAARLITARGVVNEIPALPPDAHKGIRGKLVIAGGSPGLTGAPCMVALGAARAGAGLIRVGVPRSLNAILEGKLTEEMTFPLPETEAGTLSIRAKEVLLSLREGWNALVLGPGMGRHPETERLAREIYEGWSGPLVVDADGLNALAAGGLPSVDPMRPAPVLTPHLGEMARLTGLTMSEIAADPIASARRFAQQHAVVLVLKGAPTVVSDPTGNVLVNTTGNAGLATGGSGDVLSGIIGAFLAQGVDPWWAAAAGVYLHGASADRIAERAPLRSIRPTEVAAGIGDAWKSILKEADGA